MIEKEYPIFAFEEMRRFGENQEQNKNELSILEAFIEKHGIEGKPKRCVFNVFVEKFHQQYRKARTSFYQILLHKNCILLEFLIKYKEDENVDEIYFKIQNCNKIFVEEGREGIKKTIRLLWKGKHSTDFFEELYKKYDIDFMLLIHYTRNIIQLQNTEQEQILKVTYKIDL